MSQITVATLAADLGDGLRTGVEVLLFAARDDDGCAEAGEFDGDGLAETRPGAGDQHGYAIEGPGRESAGSHRRWFGKSGHGQLPR